MNTVPVIFSKSKSLPSYAIRLITWSRWSHCGLISECGDYVYEARFWYGVVKTPIEEFKVRYPDIEICQVRCINIQDTYDFIKEQVGKKYDNIGALGIGLRTPWNHPDKWSCSELLAGADIGIFAFDRVGRISPEHIWMVRTTR